MPFSKSDWSSNFWHRINTLHERRRGQSVSEGEAVDIHTSVPRWRSPTLLSSASWSGTGLSEKRACWWATRRTSFPRSMFQLCSIIMQVSWERFICDIVSVSVRLSVCAWVSHSWATQTHNTPWPPSPPSSPACWVEYVACRRSLTPIGWHWCDSVRQNTRFIYRSVLSSRKFDLTYGIGQCTSYTETVSWSLERSFGWASSVFSTNWRHFKEIIPPELNATDVVDSYNEWWLRHFCVSVINTGPQKNRWSK